MRLGLPVPSEPAPATVVLRERSLPSQRLRSVFAESLQTSVALRASSPEPRTDSPEPLTLPKAATLPHPFLAVSRPIHVSLPENLHRIVRSPAECSVHPVRRTPAHSGLPVTYSARSPTALAASQGSAVARLPVLTSTAAHPCLPARRAAQSFRIVDPSDERCPDRVRPAAVQLAIRPRRVRL